MSSLVVHLLPKIKAALRNIINGQGSRHHVILNEVKDLESLCASSPDVSPLRLAQHDIFLDVQCLGSDRLEGTYGLTMSGG